MVIQIIFATLTIVVFLEVVVVTLTTVFMIMENGNGQQLYQLIFVAKMLIAQIRIAEIMWLIVIRQLIDANVNIVALRILNVLVGIVVVPIQQ
jgi:hypothetical protein